VRSAAAAAARSGYDGRVSPRHKALSTVACALLAASIFLPAVSPQACLASAVSALLLSFFLRAQGAFREDNTPLLGALLIGGSSVTIVVGIALVDSRLAFLIIGAVLVPTALFLAAFGVRERLRSIGRTLDDLVEKDQTCTLCAKTVAFQPELVLETEDAVCPGCGARQIERLVGLYLRRFPGKIAGRRVVYIDPGKPVGKAILAAGPANFRGMEIGLAIGAGTDEFRRELEEKIPDDGSVDLVVTARYSDYLREWLDLATLARILAADGQAILVLPRDARRDESSANYAANSAAFELTEFSATPEECKAHGISSRDRLLVATRLRV
jgi:hypothetical protein